MTARLWIVLGLATFDGLVLALFYVKLRRHAPLSNQDLYAVCAGLVCFAFVAFMFFSGGVLVVQLATIVGVFAICRWAPRKERLGIKR